MLDKNLQSPLHVSSYFGDFKASRVLTARGAEPAPPAYAVRPLEVGKDKFTRSVLQNLNKAATEANTKDVRFLVNCGNNIDKRLSIFGEAPIHKAVLCDKQSEKLKTLESILGQCHANVNNMDANGWTSLHHASYIGDLESASILIENGANVNAFSN
jgi:ankyrin repeat protein